MRKNPLNPDSTREPVTVRHKTCRITILSYLLSDGRWVPKAWVSPSPESEEPGQPIVDDVEYPLATQEAADRVAKKKAIEWVDETQYPSATS
jgi:hypothetical protein